MVEVHGQHAEILTEDLELPALGQHLDHLLKTNDLDCFL